MARPRLTPMVTSLAVVALALWVGGLLVLGAWVAPLVFESVPAPYSGDAMGAVFRRFDAVAIACGVVVLACEAARISLRAGPASRGDAARGWGAILMVGAAVYQGIVVSPLIMSLHRAGAVRGLGDDGFELERLHRLAELSTKAQILVGLVTLVLQVLTLTEAGVKEV